jgi:hypothetical protein
METRASAEKLEAVSKTGKGLVSASHDDAPDFAPGDEKPPHHPEPRQKTKTGTPDFRNVPIHGFF